MADGFVGDVMSGPLVDDVADRYEKRRADGEHGGDIRLVHRPTFPRCWHERRQRIAQGVGARRSDLFE
jgi:hypothetical protein